MTLLPLRGGVYATLNWAYDLLKLIPYGRNDGVVLLRKGGATFTLVFGILIVVT